MGTVDSFDAILALTAAITIIYQLSFFFVAAYFKFDKVTDFAGGTNFMVLAVISILLSALPDPNSRQITITILIIAWGIRLSGFLLYRVLLFEKDNRFDGTREDCCKFLVFWIFQMLWVWIVSLPMLYVNSSDNNGSNLNLGDLVGFIIAIVGLLIEGIADQQKLYFK
jgi:steroid 5-alpha reductase family enzyme